MGSSLPRELSAPGPVACAPLPVPMSAFVRLQKILPQHLLSRAAGRLAASEGWVRGPLIRAFARAYDVDMAEAERPDLADYRSFNDFFTRSLGPDARPIDPAPGAVVSPADGVVSQTGVVQDGQVLQAKGIRYSFEALAGACADPAFEGGPFATVYLSPSDYHRVHLPLAGRLVRTVAIPGKLFSVNATTEAGVEGLFAVNEREAREAAEKAREDGADLVIGVVQTDMANDRELIASHAFDVIMSGDDHSYATAYDGVTAYVETSMDARFLSPLDLNVTIGEKDGERTVSWTPSFRFIDTATVTPDPETQKIVDDFQKKLDDSLGIVIGKSDTALDSRRNIVRSQESAMGDLIADAMREASGADVAITNGGGIRADRTYDAGSDLTRGDILAELPFGNVTVVTEIPGSQILSALENGFSQVETGGGRFPQVSGMEVVYDPTAPAGSRVVSVTIGGEDLDKDKVYKVATNDYMLSGGDGYGALGGGKILVNAGNGNLMANDVMAYIEAKGTVSPEIEGRIKKVGE